MPFRLSASAAWNIVCETTHADIDLNGRVKNMSSGRGNVARIDLTMQCADDDLDLTTFVLLFDNPEGPQRLSFGVAFHERPSKHSTEQRILKKIGCKHKLHLHLEQYTLKLESF
jgi:hypothetical protein